MINSYNFGNIRTDGQKYTKDLTIDPDHIISNWQRKTGHLLAADGIAEIIDY